MGYFSVKGETRAGARHGVSSGGRIPRAKVQILLSELSTLFEVRGVGRDLQVGWPWLLTHPVTSCPFFSNGKHPQGSATPPWGPTLVTFSGTLLRSSTRFWRQSWSKRAQEGLRKLLLRPALIQDTQGLLQCQGGNPRRWSAWSFFWGQDLAREVPNFAFRALDSVFGEWRRSRSAGGLALVVD